MNFPPPESLPAPPASLARTIDALNVFRVALVRDGVRPRSDLGACDVALSVVHLDLEGRIAIVATSRTMRGYRCLHGETRR